MARGKTVRETEAITVGSWRIRRNFMFAVAGFSMSVVALTLIADRTGTVAEIAVQCSYWILFGILLLYVFGVTIQDIIMLKNGWGVLNGTAGTTATTQKILETNTHVRTVTNSGDGGVQPTEPETGS